MYAQRKERRRKGGGSGNRLDIYAELYVGERCRREMMSSRKLISGTMDGCSLSKEQALMIGMSVSSPLFLEPVISDG